MSKFTPGPWHISLDGNDIENVNDAGVCALYADETSEANAKLISIAPDMYELLNNILTQVTQHGIASLDGFRLKRAIGSLLVKIDEERSPT